MSVLRDDNRSQRYGYTSVVALLADLRLALSDVNP